MADHVYFDKETFLFLKELAANNNRLWFKQNKKRYEALVRDPAIGFITDFGVRLQKISRNFTADPRPAGGSLFRIYRDTRFSKDKTPYKKNTGIQFLHKLGKDVHAPGYYLHLEPRNVFAAAGIWHPDSATLGKIREAIAENPAGWKRASRGKTFRATFELTGDALRRAPKGYDPDHPLIEDLKRKDFIGITYLTQRDITSSGFPDEFEKICRAGTSFMRFLCMAVGLPY